MGKLLEEIFGLAAKIFLIIGCGIGILLGLIIFALVLMVT